MPTDAAPAFHLVERAGPGGRVQLRRSFGSRTEIIAVSGYRGPEIRADLTDASAEPTGPGSWRLRAREGALEFAARAVDAIETRPGLFDDLHRPFALGARERLAARALLALLRLPGGAGWLRRWHAKRSR
jgi:hypothetical protein